jgi:hypothetical protein
VPTGERITLTDAAGLLLLTAAGGGLGLPPKLKASDDMAKSASTRAVKRAARTERNEMV